MGIIISAHNRPVFHALGLTAQFNTFLIGCAMKQLVAIEKAQMTASEYNFLHLNHNVTTFVDSPFENALYKIL